VQRVSIEIPLSTYDRFIARCEKFSLEYEVLKNGLINKSNRNDRFVKIDCTSEDAKKLLSLATKACPDVLGDIARGMTISVKSD
jgi:hypothetical protein